MNLHLTDLERLPAVDIEAFADAQFRREPRLRLLQQAYHCLQRTKQHWAEIGVFGAAGQQMINPRWRMSEALANANLPRATLHDYQAEQIELALRTALGLQKLIAAHGMKVGSRPMTQAPYWCDLAGARLGTRLHVEDAGAWLFQRYDVLRDADLPMEHITMVAPLKGGARVAVICQVLPCTSALSHNRALEAAELGRWGLRQPAYCPVE